MQEKSEVGRQIPPEGPAQRLLKRAFEFDPDPDEWGWCVAQKTPAWQRKEGKNPKGGLNEKGRRSYNKANPGKPGLKAPAPNAKAGTKDGNRRKSFCARMQGMKAKNTSSKTANDPNSRINKSLRAWNC